MRTSQNTEKIGRRATLLAATVAGFILAVGSNGPAAGRASFITVDAPNAASTSPLAINQFGDVAGAFTDKSDHKLGFVRFSVDGTVEAVEFDGQDRSNVKGINDDLVITGDWVDSNFIDHCYVGTVDHTFHSCDPKDAMEAFGIAVNNQTHKGTAAVVGEYSDAQEHQHGFIWEAGVATEFDVPGSTSTGAPMDINDNGTIAGTWRDAQGTHGFVRTHDGNISTFDAENCGTTIPQAINNAGAIVGLCQDDKGFHSFIENSNGTSIIFDPPGALQGPGSEATGINNKGAITGIWTDEFEQEHGYIRSAGVNAAPQSTFRRDPRRIQMRSTIPAPSQNLSSNVLGSTASIRNP